MRNHFDDIIKLKVEIYQKNVTQFSLHLVATHHSLNKKRRHTISVKQKGRYDVCVFFFCHSFERIFPQNLQLKKYTKNIAKTIS